jgi:hypothetical protein
MEKHRARSILIALVVTHIVLNALAFSAMSAGASPNRTFSPCDIALYALFMLGPSQGALLAIWVALGGGRLAWRWLVIVPGAIIYVLCCFLAHGSSRSGEEWLIISLVTMGVAIVALLLARFAGLRLAWISEAGTPSGPFQFYIRDMLLLTTAVAVVLSIWRCVPKAAFAFLTRAIPAVTLAGFLVVVGASMFSALGRGWIVARVLLLPIAVVSTAVLLNKTIPAAAPVEDFVVLISLMMFWLVASLLVLRFAGYRLTWRSWRARPLEQSPA